MRIHILGFVLMLGLISCSETETPGGVKFTTLKKGDGIEIETGKFVMVHMVLRNHKDSLLLSTYKEDQPMVMPMPDASMAEDTGEFGVIKMLTKGDCVTFKLPAKTVYTKRRRAVPKNIDPSSLFTFILHMKESMTLEEAKKYEAEQIAKMEQQQLQADSKIIAEHLAAKKIEALSTPSGIRYVIDKAGKGEFAKPSQIAYVHYAGFLLDGKIFDTSLASVAKANNFNNGNRNEPYLVTVGAREVIQGWDEILLLMNKGMKITVFIPSGLAYGTRGKNQIPPNTNLMFTMEVVDIK